MVLVKVVILVVMLVMMVMMLVTRVIVVVYYEHHADYHISKKKNFQNHFHDGDRNHKEMMQIFQVEGNHQNVL